MICMKSSLKVLASTLTIATLSLGGVSSAVALPHAPLAANTQQDSESALEAPTLRLGGDYSNSGEAQLQFYPEHGTLQDGNSFTIVPGDRLASTTNIVNTGPTEGVLQVYVTEVEYTTPTSLSADEWFKQVEFHTDDGKTSLYEAIRNADSSEHGALILQEIVAQGDSHPLNVQLVFPEDATAGHDNTDRSFTFHIAAVMTDSRILDDGSKHPSGKPGKKHPPGKEGQPHPGLKNSQNNGNGHGREHAPGQQKGENHPGNKNSSGKGHGRTNGEEHEYPDIIAGLPSDNNGGWFLIGLGILTIVTTTVAFTRKQPKR